MPYGKWAKDDEVCDHCGQDNGPLYAVHLDEYGAPYWWCFDCIEEV